MRGLGARDDQQARGFLVDAMDDARPFAAGIRWHRAATAEERVDERPAPVAWRRVHHHAGGLVDHEEMFILVHDRQGNVLGQYVAPGGRRHHHRDGLAAPWLVAGPFGPGSRPRRFNRYRLPRDERGGLRAGKTEPARHEQSRRTSLSASLTNSCRVPDESSDSAVTWCWMRG